MVGLPRSGKSTWARESGHPVVNPDSIRLCIHGQPYYPPAEPMVWAIAKIMVSSLFKAGHKVVVLDATNTTRSRRALWKSDEWNRDYKLFNTDKDTCIKRAIATKQDYLIPIIEKMAKEFEPLHTDETEKNSYSAPRTVRRQR
jgi:predicted kinase